jgi:hypothetical protein
LAGGALSSLRLSWAMSSFTSSIGAWVEAASAENSKELAFESSIGLSDDLAPVCTAASGAFAAGVGSADAASTFGPASPCEVASAFELVSAFVLTAPCGLASTLGPVSAS